MWNAAVSVPTPSFLPPHPLGLSIAFPQEYLSIDDRAMFEVDTGLMLTPVDGGVPIAAISTVNSLVVMFAQARLEGPQHGSMIDGWMEQLRGADRAGAGAAAPMPAPAGDGPAAGSGDCEKLWPSAADRALLSQYLPVGLVGGSDHSSRFAARSASMAGLLGDILQQSAVLAAAITQRVTEVCTALFPEACLPGDADEPLMHSEKARYTANLLYAEVLKEAEAVWTTARTSGDGAGKHAGWVHEGVLRSIANMLAPEAYVGRGTVLDVVFRQQLGYGAGDPPAAVVLQSAVENGLHALFHLSPMQSSTSKGCYKQAKHELTGTSKYLVRWAVATNDMVTALNGNKAVQRDAGQVRGIRGRPARLPLVTPPTPLPTLNVRAAVVIAGVPLHG